MELPRLQPLYEKLHAEGFEILAVEGKRDTERAQKFIADNGLSFTFVENGEGDDDVVKGLYHVQAYPTSMLISRDGKVMYYHLGFEPGDEATLEEQIKTLL